MRLFKNWYLVKSPKLKPEKGAKEYPIRIRSAQHSKKKDIKEWLIKDDELFQYGFQDGYLEAIINIIIDFGNGETEFHTLDINRLVVENQRMKDKLGITEI